MSRYCAECGTPVFARSKCWTCDAPTATALTAANWDNRAGGTGNTGASMSLTKDDEAAIERAINDKGLNAPRLKPEGIDAVIVSETFTTLPSGKCMVCELTLANGFTVRGEASAVSKENFNVEIGMTVSRKKAREQVWPLEGYLLQQRLHDAKGAALDPHGKPASGGTPTEGQ